MPSAEVAYPLTLPTPVFPPNALEGAVVMFEVTLDQAGNLTEARGVQSLGGYEGVSRDALATMRFRGAAYRARPVQARAYVMFGFRPVTGPCAPINTGSVSPVPGAPPDAGNPCRCRLPEEPFNPAIPLCPPKPKP